MKKIAWALFYFFIAIYSVIFFAPKINLYYQLEELMQERQIVVTQEDIKDYGFSMAIKDGSLYYGDLMVAKFDKISILSLLVFNQISIDPLMLSEDMKNFFPRNIEGATILYTPLNPLHVSLKASGDFGSMSGDINLLERKITIDLEASKKLLSKKPFWMKKLKKTETGGYQYATTY
jgi:hypothetical protein